MTKKTTAATLAALLLTAGIASCSSTPTVPDVTGMDTAQARTTLAQAGYHDIDARDGLGNSAFTGTVDTQDPKGGTQADRDTRISLGVTTETDKARALDATVKRAARQTKGMDAKEAIELLESQGILGHIYLAQGPQGDDNRQRILDDTAAGRPWTVVATLAHTIISDSVDLTCDATADTQAGQGTDTADK